MLAISKLIDLAWLVLPFWKVESKAEQMYMVFHNKSVFLLIRLKGILRPKMGAKSLLMLGHFFYLAAENVRKTIFHQN